LSRPTGIALGPEGDLYVFEGRGDVPNQRVQVFTEDGEFVRMFGGGVDHTTGADVCTAADVVAGDECGAGSEGAGPGEFSSVGGAIVMAGDLIDFGPGGKLYVADTGRIQEFAPSGQFEGQISFADVLAGEPAFPDDRLPGMLAVDPVSGDLYVGFRTDPGFSDTRSVWRITPLGAAQIKNIK